MTALPRFPQIDDMLCFSIYSATHAFNRVYKPLLDPLGLTYPQFLVMVSLWARDDQTVGELGEALFLESSTLTPLIKRLEANGLLTRTRSKADERQVRIALTPAGADLKTKAGDLPKCVFEATGLELDELIRLQGQIARLRDHMRAHTR